MFGAHLGATLHLLQAKRPKGRGGAAPDLAIANARQFHRVATDVADHALGIGPSEQHALGRQAGFFVAINDPDFQAGLCEDFFLKVRSVFGFPRGGGGDHGQVFNPHSLGQ